MASLSFRQPLTKFHAIPLVALAGLTIVVADFSLDKNLSPNEWRVTLLIGTLFSIGFYFSGLFVNAFQIRKTMANQRVFDFCLFLRTPISYLMFFIRVAPLCVMSSICALLLISTVLSQPLSEHIALMLFVLLAGLISAAHLLVERPRLGHNSWEFTP